MTPKSYRVMVSVPKGKTKALKTKKEKQLPTAKSE